MSTVVTKNVQVGTSGTPANNFTLYQPVSPDGTVRLANGNSGSTTDLVTVTSAGNVDIRASSATPLLNLQERDSGNSRRIRFLNSGTVNTIESTTGVGSTQLAFAVDGAERARIDSSGRVTTPYQPAFSAYNPAVTGNAAIVVYGLTRTNIGSHYNAATGVYTAPIAGVYVFSFNALMNVDSSYCRLLFRLNGTASTTHGDTLVGGTSGTWNAGWSYLSVGLTWVVNLAQGDTVSVWNDGPTTTFGTSYGTFSGYMLG